MKLGIVSDEVSRDLKRRLNGRKSGESTVLSYAMSVKTACLI